MPSTNKLRVTPYSGVTSLAENLPDLIEILIAERMVRGAQAPPPPA